MNIAYDPDSGNILAVGDDVTAAGGAILTDVDPAVDLSLYTIVSGILTLSTEAAWAVIRSQRDKLLTNTDWTQLQDSPVDQVTWAAYRQSLRDLPQTYTNLEDVVWPDVPSDNAKDRAVLISAPAKLSTITNKIKG
jgi:hypothetical protein